MFFIVTSHLALASIPTFDLQSLLAIPSLTIFSNSNKFWDCLFISVHHDWFRVSWLSDHVCMFWIWHHGPFHFLVAIPGPALPQRSSRRLHFDLRKSGGTPWVSPCPATTVLLYLEIYSSPGGGGDDPYPDIDIYIYPWTCRPISIGGRAREACIIYIYITIYI